ncbi:LOW QUALITY PROTEIN: ACES-like protein [Mya arenaria]|uniref:ACES-like protein n=1 Tax=Mya arenaria TaxID=6604 RepID=A0ABY7EYH7_MYAAR|nr:LOW QUALITY PROTEIN: ACES-like protein [Mya arenaria]
MGQEIHPFLRWRSYRITVFGQSAGAVGCSLHAEINRNLFQRAITNSGSAISVLNNMSVVARRNAINIAEDVRSEIRKEDCNNKGKLADIVKCKHGRTKIEDTMKLTGNKDKDEGLLVFWPVVDGDLIKVNPRDEKKFGTENNEGLQFFGSLDFPCNLLHI